MSRRHFSTPLSRGTSIGARIQGPSSSWETGFLDELVLKSRRVIPGRLIAAGFQFQFPRWALAAQNLVGRWRATGNSTRFIRNCNGE